MTSKTVMLEYSSNEFHVSLEGYEAIRQLIIRYQICKVCQRPIDDDAHRLVGRNLCLACVRDKHPTYLFWGEIGQDTYGNAVYALKDADGVMYTTTANHSDDAREDIFLSLQQAGFPVPQTYVPFKSDKANSVELGHDNWSIYGKLDDSVIVLAYSSSYPTVKAVFLSYKGGSYVELNRRNLAFKSLFERADTIIKRTAHRQFGSVYYTHLDGHEISQIKDSTLYPIIAKLEAAQWDVQRQFMPPVLPVAEATPEPEPEEPRDPHITGSSNETAGLGEEQSDQAEQAKPRRRSKLSLVKSAQEETPQTEKVPPAQEQEYEQSVQE